MATKQEVRDAALRYNRTKAFMVQGQKFEITVQITFDDDCNNKHFDFSVTGVINRIAKNGCRIWESGGCIHEEIVKHFPKLTPFVEMHGRDREGMPMYPFANGFYHLSHGNPDAVIHDWWLTEEDGDKKTQLLNAPDRDVFTYMLYEFGFINRAKTKAEKAIRALEELTGKKWINPYTPEEERMNKAPEGLLEEVKQRIAEGFYTKEAIEKRVQEEKERKFNEAREKIIESARVKMEQMRVERDIKLFILDAGLPIDNVIYYNHSKRVVFNWHDSQFYPEITWEELDKLMSYPDEKYRIPAYTVFTLNEAYKKKIDRGVAIMGDGFESCWVGEPLPYPYNSHNPKRQIHREKK